MNMRVFLIRAFTFIGGLYFVLYFILPASILEKIGVITAHEYISNGFILIGSAAFGIGLINIGYIHIRKITLLREGFVYSSVLIIGLVSMISLATYDWLSDLSIARQTKEISVLARFSRVIRKDVEEQKSDVPALGFRQERLRESLMNMRERLSGLSGDQGVSNELKEIQSYEDRLKDASTDISAFSEIADRLEKLVELETKSLSASKESSIPSKLFSLLNDGLFVALGSAMFSLLGVYIASAAYRAFRVRSIESSLMMGAALIVMLGQIPFKIPFLPDITEWRFWLLSIPNSAAFRAISLGASVAGFVLSIRMWLSIEGDGEGNV